MTKKKVSEYEESSYIDPYVADIKNENNGPRMMTLYQAWRRQIFSTDPEENMRIYMKKRRGYEGKEKRVLINIDD